MSNELPDWIQEFPEAIPDDMGNPVPKAPPLTTPARPPKTSKTRPLTLPQTIILAGLAMVLCLICAGTIGVIYTNSDLLFGLPSQEAAAAPPGQAPVGPPTATPAPGPTPTPRPTVALVEPTATAQPSPTATYAVAPEFINKDKIADIVQFVEKSRQLSLPENVPIQFLTRHQLREQWRDEAFDVAALEAVQTQQEFYAALGLIEPQVDLVEAAFSSQTDILLGYYTPEEKMMYIIAESVNMFAEEEMTFAHEYVHALQDHHFDLTAIFNDQTSGDVLLAARSLPEGDARLVEELFTMQNINKSQLDYTVYRYLFQEHPTLDGVSPALAIFTYFPYTAGEYFVLYLYIEGGFSWERVNQAYASPPVSSEQVMHPEKYLAREMPVLVTLPDLAPAVDDNWHEIDRDVLGEAGFLVWLIDQVEAELAIDAAAGWEGDAYTLWTDSANHRLLAEASMWETEADAIELFEAFGHYMDRREGGDTHYEEAGNHFWEYEAGVTLLRRQGQQVLILIAPDRTILDKARDQFTN